MSYVTYTALRRLKSGHSASTAYSIEFDSEALTPGINGVSEINKSLGGSKESIFKRFEETWNVTSTFQNESTFNDWMEFFASTAGGEAFTFDAYGTVASPDNAQTATRTGDPSFSRVGVQQYYKISFNLEVTL